MASWPWMASIDEMRTIADPGLASRSGVRSRIDTAAAVRWTAKTASHTVASSVSTGLTPGMPAPWTNPPIVPRASRLSAIASAKRSWSHTSSPMPDRGDGVVARDLLRRILGGVAVQSQIATGRPTSATAWAVARPMPDPPPVITTPVVGVAVVLVIASSPSWPAVGNLATAALACARSESRVDWGTMEDFTGKVAVVTGGASGIGEGIVEALLEAGARVAVADIEQPVLDESLGRLAGHGDTVGIVTDVSDPSRSRRALSGCTTPRTCNLLFNNAGVGGGGVAEPWNWTPNDWKWCFGVNVFGLAHCVQSFVPRMLAGGEEGWVVNTSSDNGGYQPMADLVMYAASKAAVTAYSEALENAFRNEGTALHSAVFYPGGNGILETACGTAAATARTGSRGSTRTSTSSGTTRSTRRRARGRRDGRRSRRARPLRAARRPRGQVHHQPPPRGGRRAHARACRACGAG